MASSSSAPFVVVEHTSSEHRFTNLWYCCPGNTRQFVVSLPQGPPWPFTTIQKKKKLYLAIFNGKNVFSIQFPPPPNGFDVDVLRIMVELLPESSTPTQMITASTLGREFRNTFHHQVFTEYQRVVFAYKGSSYACSVVEISLSENEGIESLRSTKQGMIRKRTKVIVEVPTQSLGTLIHGAETFKIILREGFNMESLEEELISLGIGGMTSQFAQILQSAFGSRMAPLSQAKRYNIICPLLFIKRGVVMGQHHMDDRLVNQLLTMIDGMKELNNIFIIATTNRKELIDEALLREGRIELHVKLEYPDERGRLQILDINTRNMRQVFVLDEDVNLQEIACRTDGYSGSTIASLVTRAYSYAVVQARERGLVQDVKILQPFSSSNLTEVLHIQQDIARLKEDSAHFQATLASYKEDVVKLEKELETLRCALDRM
ncbi:Vesicle-fusing ATPase [Camellia lanceoleosa]|uniref:Vesicle-fusing ATPase n=1 Tax=Camellia lanceoleosa TaxID=1840588 RepID=A0ACC0HSI6_9ERIC|nr:Vesicle-fusing ATPase [Camellia lanceoleosa]